MTNNTGMAATLARSSIAPMWPHVTWIYSLTQVTVEALLSSVCYNNHWGCTDSDTSIGYQILRLILHNNLRITSIYANIFVT